MPAGRLAPSRAPWDHSSSLRSMTAKADAGLEPDEYWEARLRERPGLDGVGVSGLGPGFNRWAYRIRAINFERALRGCLQAGAPGRVLDIGSGTGFWIDRWERIGAREVVASDLTEVVVDRLAAKRPGLDVRRLDIGSEGALAAAGLEPGSFDCVSAIDVLFHLLSGSAYRTAFANVAALLREGGMFVFSEDMARGSGVRRRQIKVTRSARRTRRTWEAAGLEECHRSRLFVLMNFPSTGGAAARRRYRRLDRLLSPRPWLGGPVGAALFPLEWALTKRGDQGPSTKLVICRKPARSPEPPRPAPGDAK